MGGAGWRGGGGGMVLGRAVSNLDGWWRVGGRGGIKGLVGGGVEAGRRVVRG